MSAWPQACVCAAPAVHEGFCIYCGRYPERELRLDAARYLLHPNRTAPARYAEWLERRRAAREAALGVA